MIIQTSAIAVIDSGSGGIGLLKQLHSAFKNENFIYVADNDFLPYGNKSESSLKSRLEKIVNSLLSIYHIKAVVLACNTATTVALNYLRGKFNIPIYGVSPIGCTQHNGLIMCTKLTSKQILKHSFITSNSKPTKLNFQFLVMPKLATYIERNVLNSKMLDKKARQLIKKYQLGNYKRIVLGCTHYEFLYDFFCKNLSNTKIICPSKKTIADIKRDNIAYQDSKSRGMVYFLVSLPSKSYLDKLYYMFSH